jgi:hypothetical protein
MYEMDWKEMEMMTEAEKKAHYDACILSNAEEILRDSPRKEAAQKVLEKMAEEAADHAQMMADLAKKVSMENVVKEMNER